MKTLTYDPQAAAAAQDEYCKKTGAPHFAPNKYNGYRCYSCGWNIYLEGGIPVEEAATKLVTGCPYCHRSFCD